MRKGRARDEIGQKKDKTDVVRLEETQRNKNHYRIKDGGGEIQKQMKYRLGIVYWNCRFNYLPLLLFLTAFYNLNLYMTFINYQSLQIAIKQSDYFSQFNTMKYLAAYALLSLSGKKDISAADLKKVLGSANCNIADTDLNRLIETLKGKDINKLIANGLTKIGSSGSAPTGNAGSKPAAQQKKKQQPKKQAPKKKEQPKVEEEEDMGLGGGLFD